MHLISCSSPSNNLAISLTPTHPTLKQWQQPLPSLYTRSKPTNGTVWRSSPISPALTPLLPAPCMYPVLPSLFTLCFLCVKHPPQPPPLCQTGTPTPDVRLFSDVISSVESSSPRPQCGRMSSKAFVPPCCNTFHLPIRSHWPCAVFLSKDQKDLQGKG